MNTIEKLISSSFGFAAKIIQAYLLELAEASSFEITYNEQSSKLDKDKWSFLLRERNPDSNITKLVHQNERGQQTVIWIIENTIQNRIIIKSNFTEEQLKRMFHILNIQFPGIGNTEEEMAHYTFEITETGAESTIYLTAYNLRKFIKKLVYYTVYAVE